MGARALNRGSQRPRKPRHEDFVRHGSRRWLHDPARLRLAATSPVRDQRKPVPGHAVDRCGRWVRRASPRRLPHALGWRNLARMLGARAGLHSRPVPRPGRAAGAGERVPSHDARRISELHPRLGRVVFPLHWGQLWGKPQGIRAESLPGVACNTVPAKAAPSLELRLRPRMHSRNSALRRKRTPHRRARRTLRINGATALAHDLASTHTSPLHARAARLHHAGAGLRLLHRPGACAGDRGDGRSSRSGSGRSQGDPPGRRTARCKIAGFSSRCKCQGAQVSPTRRWFACSLD